MSRSVYVLLAMSLASMGSQDHWRQERCLLDTDMSFIYKERKRNQRNKAQRRKR